MKMNQQCGRMAIKLEFNEGELAANRESSAAAKQPDVNNGESSNSNQQFCQANGNSNQPEFASTAAIETEDSINGSYLNGVINSAEATRSTNTASVLNIPFLAQMSQSSKLALSNLALREKKCRVYEREANELKDVICSMNHMVHILENIKRVSSDYIHCLYELISASVRQEPEQLEHIQQDIADLDSELKQWERKYHVMSSFNASNHGPTNSTSQSFTTSMTTSLANLTSTPATNPTTTVGLHPNHNNSSIASSEHCADDQLEVDIDMVSNELELLDQSRRQNHSGNSSTGGVNGNLMVMPQELCEMSMETHEDPMTLGPNSSSPQARAAAVAAAAAAALIMNPSSPHSAAAASSPLIAAAVAAATAATESKASRYPVKSKSNSQQSYSMGPNSTAAAAAQPPPTNSSKPLFRCDHQGCDYYTNMRQRLAMHKRAHAGEMLYTCDIAGCGYQSNYKGNIKIHKKHRHRIELAEQQQQANNNVSSGTTPSSFTFTSDGQQSIAPPVVRNRTRGRKRKIRSLSPTTVVPLAKRIVDSRLPEECQNSSGEIYSGNDSGTKESDLALYECTIEGCNYRSKWKQCLTAHQFLHAGMKPYKCDYPGCNYRTNFKGNVNVHKRVHRASEFQCKISGCNFATPWKNSFLIHQRNHSNTASTTTTTTTAPISVPTAVNKVTTRSSSNQQAVAMFDAASLNLSPSSISMDSTTVNGSRLNNGGNVIGGELKVEEDEEAEEEEEEEEIDDEEEESLMSFPNNEATYQSTNAAAAVANAAVAAVAAASVPTQPSPNIANCESYTNFQRVLQ